MDIHNNIEDLVFKYLNEILNKTAIPNIQQIFEGSDKDEILSTLSIFEELSETNSRAVIPVQNLLEKLTNKTDKRIVSQSRKILINIKE